MKKQLDKWLEKFNNIEFLSLSLKLILILGLKIKIQIDFFIKNREKMERMKE